MNPHCIHRIQQMEEIYDRIRKDIATLREYEESGQWLQDYEADERGEIPRDLEEAKSLPSPSRKYPVLSEASEIGAERCR